MKRREIIWTLPPLCRCGHVKEVHRHYRDGDDCGMCGREVCEHYRSSVSLVGRLRQALRDVHDAR